MNLFGGLFEPGLDHRGDLLDGKILILVFVVENPALALGDDLLAKFLGRQFVAPVAEGAFGELLNVAFVHERDDRALVFDGVLDRPAHQSFGARGRNWLDADAGIFANFFLGAFEHFVVQEVDQLFHFGRAGLPLDSRVDVFRVFAEDHHVHALGIRYGRRNAWK